jgi:hypothetical protein
MAKQIKDPLAQFHKMSPQEQIMALAEALRDSAARCKTNFLTSGTWIEQTFDGAADRLDEIYNNLENLLENVDF